MMGCDLLAYIHPADRQTVAGCVEQLKLSGEGKKHSWILISISGLKQTFYFLHQSFFFFNNDRHLECNIDATSLFFSRTAKLTSVRSVDTPAYCIRMKSNLSKRNVTQPSSGYRVSSLEIPPTVWARSLGVNDNVAIFTSEHRAEAPPLQHEIIPKVRQIKGEREGARRKIWSRKWLLTAPNSHAKGFTFKFR